MYIGNSREESMENNNTNELTKNDYRILAELVREQIDHCVEKEMGTDDPVQKAFWRDSATHFIGVYYRIPGTKGDK